VETPAREESAALRSQSSYLVRLVSVFVFQIDEVETNFLSEISISELSHSQDQKRHRCLSKVAYLVAKVAKAKLPGPSRLGDSDPYRQSARRNLLLGYKRGNYSPLT
jgi:hypothetical protein